MTELNNVNLKIRVTNLETKAIYVHNKVPLEHVEMLRMNPNLKIEVLGQARGARSEKFNRERRG